MSFRSATRLYGNRQKSKNLPSIEFLRQLYFLCQGTQNTYDSTNHILTINNYEVFCQALAERCCRSIHSFLKQLKMTGFKRRKIVQHIEHEQVDDYNEQSEINGKTVTKFEWRGNKDSLITQDLAYSENHLTEIMLQTHKLKEELINNRKKIDTLIETVVFSTMVNSAPPDILADSIFEAVQFSREAINGAHRKSRSIINDISINLNNELSLYRLLIFKEKEEES